MSVTPTEDRASFCAASDGAQIREEWNTQIRDLKHEDREEIRLRSGGQVEGTKNDDPLIISISTSPIGSSPTTATLPPHFVASLRALVG